MGIYFDEKLGLHHMGFFALNSGPKSHHNFFWDILARGCFEKRRDLLKLEMDISDEQVNLSLIQYLCALSLKYEEIARVEFQI